MRTRNRVIDVGGGGGEARCVAACVADVLQRMCSRWRRKSGEMCCSMCFRRRRRRGEMCCSMCCSMCGRSRAPKGTLRQEGGMSSGPQGWMKGSWSLCASIRQHTSACQHTSGHVCIRMHMSAYATKDRRARPRARSACAPAYVSIRQHTSAYGSIRQHTSAWADRRAGRRAR